MRTEDRHTAENDARLTDDEREILLHAFGFQFRTPGDHERFDLAIREVERMVAARVIPPGTGDTA